MARFVGIWRFNPSAPWPTDPTEAAQLNEMLFSQIDKGLQSGGMEMGFFLDGVSGCMISDGESIDAFKSALALFPFFVVEVHEIVDYETGKRITRELLQAQAEAMRR